MATNEELVEMFQCPGCVIGSNTQCGSYNPDCSGGCSCSSHILGTMVSGIGNIALGLPKGFCRPGPDDSRKRAKTRINIRLWATATAPEWDKLNVPVWAMEREGFLYVRTYLPRINDTFVDVIEGGTLAMVPNAINVGEFIEEID